MWEIFKNVLSPSQYIPHGHCYLWQTPLVWLHIIGDLLIAIAYFSIPAMLIYFVYKRRDVPFQGIFALFGAFIILCGTGHLLEIWTLWHPTYWLSGIEKALTALISCYTAGQMVTLLPQFLSLKTPEQLEVINRKLQQEIVERHQTEQTLQRIVTGTASVTGEAFFPALVENLAQALDVRHACIAEVTSSCSPCISVRVSGAAPAERVSMQGEDTHTQKKWKTLAFWIDNHIEGNPVDKFCEADVQPTQVDNRLHSYQEDFHSAAILKARDTAYHLSVPLLDDQQQEIGILGISHDLPLASEENAKALMKVFAVRAATELQRQKAELALRGAYEDLEVRVRERTTKLVETNAALEAEIREKVAAQEALSKQLKREQLVGRMLDRIRSSLNLEEVLQAAVDEVRQFLQTDRTIVYRFNPDWGGFVVVESVGKDWMPVLGVDIQDECFKERYVSLYQQGRLRAIADIHNSDLTACHIELLSQFQVKANLVIPILQSEEPIQDSQSQTLLQVEENLQHELCPASSSGGAVVLTRSRPKTQNRLWGLLIAHHCRESRQWQEFEIECLRQLSVQILL